MRSLKLLSILTVLTLSFCSKSNHNLTFPETDYAISSQLNYSPFMGLPIFMDEVNNKLVISDFFGDSLIIIADIKNGNHTRVAPKGNGPNEFMNPLYTSKTDSSILVFNKGKFEFGYFAIKDLLKGIAGWNKLLDVPSNLSNIHPISGNSFISSGFLGSARYATVDKNGEIRKYFGDLPASFGSERNFPPDVKAMFHQVFFQKHPEKNIIASVSSHFVEIIALDSLSITKKIQIADYGYTYTSEEMLTTQLSENYPRGVTSSCCDGKYLYLLFDPSTINNKNVRNEIYVFDWDLNPIKKIIPDKNFSIITIRDNGDILGIAETPAPTIYKLK